MLHFSASSPDLSKQEEWPICMSLHYQSILLSLQSNDKYSENNHPSQCRITVTLYWRTVVNLHSAFKFKCLFFSLILLSLQRVHPNKTALKSERGQAHMNERRKLSATFTLQRKNSDASISRQQLCNNHRKFSSEFKCSSISGYGKHTERLKKYGTNRYSGLHKCRLRLIVT